MSSDEIVIFTDGSRTVSEESSCRIGCAIFIPGDRNSFYQMKLNDMTSSYMAEVLLLIRLLICVIAIFCLRLIFVRTF